MSATTFDTSAAAITAATILTVTATAPSTTTAFAVAPAAPSMSLDGIVLTAVFGGAFILLLFLLAIFIWTRPRVPAHHVELGRTVDLPATAHSIRSANRNSLNTPSSLTLGPAHDGEVWTDIPLSELPYLRPNIEQAKDATARPATPVTTAARPASPTPTATRPTTPAPTAAATTDLAESKPLTATQRLLARTPTPYPHTGGESPILYAAPTAYPPAAYYPTVLPPLPCAVRASMPIMPGTAGALAPTPTRARSASTAPTATYPWGAQRDARA